MEFVLVCDCGSTDFKYTEETFVCKSCGEVYTSERAGRHLLGNPDIE